MNNSILAAGKSCAIRSFYDVLDKDPKDTHTPDDSGVFNVTMDVAFGPVGGPASGHAQGAATVTVTDCQVTPGKGPTCTAPVPEPGAWSLLAAGMIALMGRLHLAKR
jgi:hypothetical protein